MPSMETLIEDTRKNWTIAHGVVFFASNQLVALEPPAVNLIKLFTRLENANNCHSFWQPALLA
jgi:hypothetical protein